MAALVLAAVMLVCLAPPSAQAQVTPTTYSTFSGVPLNVPAETTTNVLAAIDWRQGKSLAVFPYFARTNSQTDAIILVFDVSYDGTNYNTANTISVTNLANGTTAVRGYRLILPTEVSAVAKIRLKTIANADTNAVFVTNVVYSWSN